MSHPSRMSIFLSISLERERQEKLHAAGRFAHTCASPDIANTERLAILGEEFGEVCRAVLEDERSAFDVHGSDLRSELIHVAAVAVAWLEGMEE